MWAADPQKHHHTCPISYVTRPKYSIIKITPTSLPKHTSVEEQPLKEELGVLMQNLSRKFHQQGFFYTFVYIHGWNELFPLLLYFQPESSLLNHVCVHG